MVVGDQGSGDGLAGGTVVPDRGGQPEQALGDAGGHAVDGAAALQLQIELAFQRVVDRLDQLPYGFEQVLGRMRGAVAVVGGAAAVSRASSFGSASAQAIGSPAGVQIRCRRRPQKNREWLEP